MNVLYLSRATFPSEVTHTLSIMRMCRAFAACGHKVLLTGRSQARCAPKDVLARYGIGEEFELHLQIIGRALDNRITRKLFLPSLVFAARAGRRARQFSPDLAYSRLTLLELLAIPRKLPLIYEMHSLGPLKAAGLQRMLFRWLARRKNLVRIIVTTDTLRQALSQEFPDMDIRIARLSAERPVAMPADELAGFRSKELQGQAFRFHVGYTGYLDTFGLRGTELLCQAAARTPEAAFHIVGGDPESVAHWQRYADAHNAHGNIFFYGHRNPSEIPWFLGCFDAALAPLQFKPTAGAPTGLGMSPLKIPQYLSYGKAIIASNLPAHREMLQDRVTALLVDPADPDAWSRAIRTLMGDAALRERLEAAARERYFSEFTPEQRVQRVLDGLCVAGAGGSR